MTLDIGLQGLAILAAISLIFGLVAQLALGRRTTRWLWLIGAVAWFIGGFFASEVMFGTATEDELQPIIDGLCFDEALLGGLIAGLAAVLVTWLLTRTATPHAPVPS